jgi:HD-like signal output (HDOD) protein
MNESNGSMFTDRDARSSDVAPDRRAALERLLESDGARRLVDDIDQLPSLPTTYIALMQAAARPNTTAEDIVEIIRPDPAMSVRLLQLVNSSFFGSKSKMTSVVQAVNHLGIDLLKGLIASAHVFSALNASATRVVSVERCQLYSLRVARLAQAMVSSKQAGDEAFTAGLLHNIGELVLAVEHPVRFAAVIQRCSDTGESRIPVEREVFGATHSEVGARLLTNWGIPFPIVEVAAFHHEPDRVPGGDVEVLAAVHTADALLGILTCGDPFDMLNIAFLERAGLARDLPRWRELIKNEVATWEISD